MNFSPSDWRGARQRAAAAALMLSSQWWGLVLAAGIIAAGLARLIYAKLDLPQRYSEWIVGAIAWTYEDKFHDYAVLVGFVVAFALTLSMVLLLAARLKADFGIDGLQRFHDSLLLLCAPAGLWLGGLLTTRNASLELFNASLALLVAFVLLVALFMRKGVAFWQHDAMTLFWALHCALLASATGAFAACAIGVAVNRIGALAHVQHWLGPRAVIAGAWLAVIAVLALVLLLLMHARRLEALMQRFKQLTLGLQALLPLLLLCLVPPAWIQPDGALSSGYQLSTLGHVVVLTACAWAAVSLFRLARRALDEDAPRGSPFELISLGSAVAVLLFLKMAPIGLPIIDADDYHFGEMLVPWWSWAEKGMIPFWDYVPARGLLNYVPGALSSLVFDGTPGTFRATYAFLFVFLAPLTLLALRAQVGMGLAFLAVLLGPMTNGVGEIDLTTTAFIAAMCWGYFRWSAYSWLATYATLGTALLLYTPGQGALSLIACSPVALLQVWRQWSTSSGALLRLTLVIAVTGALFVTLTPLGRMLVGAIRYGAEQSSINSIAHGVNWNLSFGSANVNPWLFEAMRVGWLAVAAWAAVLLLKAALDAHAPDRAKTLVFASVIFLVLMLFTVRTAGRIDIGASRLGLASSWALALLVPLLLSLARIRGAHVLAWVTAAGMVTPFFGGLALPTLAQNFIPLPATAFDHQAAVQVHGDAILGSDIVDKAQLARITATRQVLAEVLEPQETYLDLTGRHAMYFYVGRKPPIETGAMYNLVGEAQQLRAIEALRAARVPAVLLRSDNITHDGGPSSLRSNLLYREVLLSKGYKLATIGQQLWLIRDDRVPRLSGRAGTVLREVDAKPDSPLTALFQENDLKLVPASWGRSYATLQRRAEAVLEVTPAMIASHHDVARDGDDYFTITGPDPFVRFDISSAHLRGQDAGLLSFDFACIDAPKVVPQLRFFWASSGATENAAASFSLEGRQGRLVIPVDSSPAWLLSPQIATIRFDVENELQACARFSITTVRLLRRTATMAQGKPAQ